MRLLEELTMSLLQLLLIATLGWMACLCDSPAEQERYFRNWCSQLKFGTLPKFKCIETAKGYIIQSGVMGTGVGLEIMNDGELFDIFSKCSVGPNRTIPLCRPENLVSPEEFSTIKVFYKRPIRSRVQNKAAYAADTSFPAVDKEIMRVRSMGRLGFGAAVFDIYWRNDSRMHELQTDGYFMELVDGTDMNLHWKSVSDGNFSIKTKQTNLLSKLIDASRKHLAEHSIESIALVEQEYKTWKIETALQMRDTLSIGVLITKIVQNLWYQGYVHCDFHSGNVFMRHKRMQVNENNFNTFKNRYFKGEVFPLNANKVYWSQPYPAAVSELDGISEIVYFEPTVQQCVLVDTGSALSLNYRIKSGVKKSDIPSPCLFSRVNHREDAYWYWNYFFQGAEMVGIFASSLMEMMPRAQTVMGQSFETANILDEIHDFILLGVTEKWSGKAYRLWSVTQPTLSSCLYSKVEMDTHVVILENHEDNPFNVAAFRKMKTPANQRHPCSFQHYIDLIDEYKKYLSNIMKEYHEIIDPFIGINDIQFQRL